MFAAILASHSDEGNADSQRAFRAIVFYVALSLRERIAEESHAAARQAAAILSQSERAT